MAKQCYYRIGSNEAGLTYLLALHLPPPDLVQFTPFATRRPASQGGQSRQGYISCSILWNRMDSLQANTLYEIIAAIETTSGQGNATLWLTLPRADASAPGQNWVDVSGIVAMPGWETENQSNGRTYTNILMTVNDVTVQNEPSNIFD